MKELPADQVILADQLLMDLMNKQPYLEAAQYQLMLSLALKSARVIASPDANALYQTLQPTMTIGQAP
jgi:hypothetical protein